MMDIFIGCKTLVANVSFILHLLVGGSEDLFCAVIMHPLFAKDEVC